MTTAESRFGRSTPTRVRRWVVAACCALYFPAVFVGGVLAPPVLAARFGVPFDAAMRYSVAALLVAYLGGLAVLFRR